ncbi:hypothetical protein Pint_27399 [Pistacia integerrima]|uniref:Uncharacterized protein n=1 Tax=Pistacia integerrima TaxID=434235 RepID=A0ACC0YS35_9ROSI|nr:hypothetical protein Pint_27399 [Pistacia integerrima]
MAGLFDKQAKLYVDARPTYPSEWYSMLASHTTLHCLAWDVGTGNGQAAFGVAEHYEQVVATDVSEDQLENALPHPRVRYLHTPLSLSDDELVTLIGGENSVDLVTGAQAVHWFDLPKFYTIINRVLRKPGGVIAVWGYKGFEVSPTFNALMKKFYETTIPYWNQNAQSLFDGYKDLPFPFESVGLGFEGQPLELDMPKELSLEGFLRMLRSWSAINSALEQGVDLLSESVVKEFEGVWGGSHLIRTVTYKAFMLVGKVKV